VIALYLNAALLASLLVAYLARGSGSSALAAPNGLPQITGGNGVYVMPAQFSQYNYGCYLIDTDKETLCAYEYIQGSKELKFIAARYFHHDREMQSFNTSPSPEEIKKINQTWHAGIRGQEPVQPPATIPAAPPERPAVQPVTPPQDGPINGVAPRDDAPTAPTTRPNFTGPATGPTGPIPTPNEINSGVPHP
jgi:hypothetical protein